MSLIKRIWGYAVFPIIGTLVALILLHFVRPTTVVGPSMEPNLSDSEHVWSFSNIAIHRGSVIIFNSQGVDPTSSAEKLYVKRIIGIPGDRVTCNDGDIYVNNRPIKQSYISKKEKEATGSWDFKKLARKHHWLENTNTTIVPNGKYFVLGDHRSVSNDSRYFGFVPYHKIIGVVKIFWWTQTPQRSRININKEWKDFWQIAS